MQAILHGKADNRSGRGTPPKSIAAKYTSPGKDAPEQHGENRGGTWGEEHHKRAKEKVKEERHKRKKDKKHLKKGFEDFYKTHDLSSKTLSNGKAAATIVMDDNGRILLGKHKGGLAIPGGMLDDADMGDFAIGALRELKEEAGIVGHNPTKVWEGTDRGNHVKVFLVESWTGTPKHGDDLGPLQWMEPQDIDWSKIRDCCVGSLKSFIEQKLGKSLNGMVALENLEKNIIRQKADAVFEVTHGDALKLIGTGLFRRIREAVQGMQDEDFKDVQFDTYTLSIRRHMSDVYSGRVNDGHKIVYQFTNKSLPEVTAALMSVFEWYLPEDEKELHMLDDVDDDVIHGGLQTLIDNYKKHNIGNIYEEMETIREQIRNGVAVDIQQVEARIMSLFDKLEDVVHDLTDKHNSLAQMAGAEVDELERKLRELQSKLDDMGKMPSTVEAYSVHRPNPAKIHDENYPYLPRPQVEISPNGKIKITFASEWTDLEKQNFLHDLRAKAIKRGKSND
jgi:8-oxo-dGTP pyrophosphatase MutT (NUDIX family)/Txe/YoeB family toxin of Txe-Axe toxin-antitoxin module